MPKAILRMRIFLTCLTLLAIFFPRTHWAATPVRPEIVQGDQAICPGGEAQLEIAYDEGSIDWIQGAASLSCDDCPNPIATPSQTTVYKAVVTTPDLVDTLVITVSIFSLDAGPDLTVCEGEDIQIVAAGDFPNVAYAWTVSPASGVNLSCRECPDPVITAVDAGTYTLTVSLSPGEGDCDQTDQMELVVNDQPAPEYTISNRETGICIGSPATIGVDQFSGNLSFSWTSEPGSFTSDQATFTVSPTVTTKYYVEIDNGQCGSPSLDSVLVQVSQVPEANVANNATLCIGDTISLGPGPIEEGVVYSWSGPEGVIDQGNPQSEAVPQSSGTYTLTANRDGCISRATFDVTVNTADVEIVQGDTFFLCVGGTVDLEARLTGTNQNFPISWTSDDPDFTPVTGPNISVAPADSTLYSATITAGNCVQTASVLVVVDSLPQDLSILPSDTTICEGQYVILETPAYETSDFPSIDFTWRPFRGQQSPDSLLNMVVTPDTTLTYYRITENGGCRDSTAAVVNVNNIEQISIVPDETTLCAGETVDLRIEGPDDLEDIAWTPENGLGCTDCEDPTATAINSVTYSVQATYMDCPLSASTDLIVVPSPAYRLTTQTVICPGDQVQLNSVFDADANYSWTSTDPNFPENPGDETNPTVVVSPDATATYTLTADNGFCDPVTAEVTIEVVAYGDLEITASTTILQPGESATLTANLEGGTSIDQYEWSGTDGSTATGEEITVSPQQTTTYTLRVTVGPGCDELVDEITINVFAVDVPNAFTPNGDGSNDIFNFTSAGDVGEVLRFQVFNRWGQLVFDNDSSNGWDGTKGGKPQPSDVYAYIIVLQANDGEEYSFDGDVTLIR